VEEIMKEAIYDYDPAAALENEESIAVFLADALETGDTAYIAKAMGVVARAKGMTALSRETGLSREQLYRSFSEKGNPTLKNMLAVMRALGVDMTVKPHKPAGSELGSR
jgi:probable addiction module antidote protein